jgi:hypothetical protein
MRRTGVRQAHDCLSVPAGLPQLGFMNDLLYFADAVAPGSFNDILFGNNVTSFHLGGPFVALFIKGSSRPYSR